MPIWNSSSLPLNYLIHNDSNIYIYIYIYIIHNKHAHKYIGSERGKRGIKKRRTKGILGKVASLLQRDLHSMRDGTWDSFTHEKEGGSSFVEERDGPSSSVSESDELEASPELWKKSNSTGFSKLWRFEELVQRSNSDGKERGLALCGLVLGCCDNGLKERQRMGWRRGKKQPQTQGRERERKIFFFFFGWVYSDLPKQWAGWNFLRVK